MTGSTGVDHTITRVHRLDNEERSLGLVIGSAIRPEEVGDVAALAERSGFDELWLPEDYFHRGGIAAAAIALGATRTIPVGLGIVSAMVRHPAVLAMEVGTLARAYPGRARAGIGLGAPVQLRRMALYPRTQLGAIRECTEVLRGSLAGDVLNYAGSTFRADGVGLSLPPAEMVEIYFGVINQKMLALAGELADGTVIGLTAGPEYVRWARDQIASGARRKTEQEGKHRIVSMVICSLDKSVVRARQAARHVVARYLASVGPTAYTECYGYSKQLAEILERASGDTIAERQDIISKEMPDEWLDHLAIAGGRDECLARVIEYFEAGSHSVVVCPAPAAHTGRIAEVVGTEVIPRLRRSG